jgi:hypothetical protein
MSEAGIVTPLKEILTESGLYDKYVGGTPENTSPKKRGRPSEGKGFGAPSNTFNPEEHNNDVLNGLDLHNPATPQFHILREKPEHRFLIYLFAQGNSTKDIFLQLGGEWDAELNKPIPGTGQYTYPWLTQIRKQAWFREQLTNFLHAAGKDLIAAKLETEVSPSLEVVISIRDDITLPASVRLRAADSLIDRHLGKPIQHIKSELVKTVDSFEKSAETLQAELDQIDAELKAHNASL